MSSSYCAAENTSFVPFNSFSTWILPPPLILRWSLFFQRYFFSQNPYNEQDPGTEVASTIKKMHENRAQRETNKKVLKGKNNMKCKYWWGSRAFHSHKYKQNLLKLTMASMNSGSYLNKQQVAFIIHPKQNNKYPNINKQRREIARIQIK